MTEKEKNAVGFLNEYKDRGFYGILTTETIQTLLNLIENLIDYQEKIKSLSVTNLIQDYETGQLISKSKLKEFFSSRLEKYCEADDGMYQQDYLTRGELELVDRYKECRELAKIILEEDIEPEVPQDCIKKDIIREEIKYLKSLEFGTDLVTQSTANLTTIIILQKFIGE